MRALSETLPPLRRAAGAPDLRAPARCTGDRERLDRVVSAATSHAGDLHLRLRPILREIAADGLRRRGVELDAQPQAAQQLLAPDTWELVRPDRPRPDDAFARGLAPAAPGRRPRRPGGSAAMTSEPHPRHVAAPAEAILDEVERAVVGKRDVLELVLLALLADGHVLLEDVPGVAKTLIARSFAAATGLRFGRVQFTPDLLPSDVTGSSVFDQRTASFEFRPGRCSATCSWATRSTAPRRRRRPRCWRPWRSARSPPTTARTSSSGPSSCSPPRTRSSTRAPTRCPRPSSTASWCACASATRRPTTNGRMLDARARRGTDAVALNAIIDGHGLRSLQAAVEAVHVGAAVGRYMVALATATRESPEVEVGASPRGSLALLRLSRARAALEGRDFVVPDDVKAVAVPALAHRLVLRPELWVRRVDAADVVRARARRRARPARDGAPGR